MKGNFSSLKLLCVRQNNLSLIKLFLAAGGLLSLLIAGCTKSPTSLQTSPDVLTDLRALASEVKTFDMQGMSSMMSKGMSSTGNSLAKRAASSACVSGMEIEDWSDSTLGDSSYSGIDTTWYFDQSGNPVCPGDVDMYSRLIISSHYSGPDEIWKFSGTIDNVVYDTMHLPDSFSVQMRVTQSGSVTRHDGFYFAIENSVFNLACFVRDTVESFQLSGSYVLSFDSGMYIATISFVNVDKLFSDEDFGDNELVLKGPITHDGQTVGSFEVYGDDHVMIRDAQGNDVGH